MPAAEEDGKDFGVWIASDTMNTDKYCMMKGTYLDEDGDIQIWWDAQ